MKRWVLFFTCIGCAISRSIGAQVPLIDDPFSSNPCAGGDWICQGSAVWVPPLSASQSCEVIGADPNNPYGDGIDDCTLYPNKGYMLLTPGRNDQSGNIFRQQNIIFDNFKMTVVVELRDGTITRPADGLCVVIVETDDGNPPGLGASGGAMGATGLSNQSTMIFELDNWSGNNGDQNDDNHAGFTWSKTGFPGVDSICSPRSPGLCKNDAFAKIDGQLYPLNNKQPPPAQPNRFELTVFVQNGSVACNLRSVDLDHDFGRLYTYQIPDFAPFLGYLGVTASTGTATQNHIVHSVRLEELPPDFCLAPPGSVSRTISGRRDPRFACGDFGAGDLLNVALEITDLRAAGASCGAPTGIAIQETPPAGWAPFAISDGGSYDSGLGVIQWTITEPALSVGKTVSYRTTALNTADASVSWSGSFAEDIPLSPPGAITGDDTILRDTPLGPCGGIKCWNVLGAFTQPGGAAPGEDAIRSDYLTDGSIRESSFVWYPGATIETAFGGDGVTGSAATGLLGGLAGRNPAGLPEVFAWNDPDGFINLNDDAFGGDPSLVMAYAQAYVTNTTGASLSVYIGSSSDDSIQILLDGHEVWIHNVPRAGSDDCAPQDVSPDGVRFFGPHILTPGEHSLVVKTFEGAGGWGFSVRFQDELGIPITQGLEVRKVPAGACIIPPLQATRDVVTVETAPIEGVPSPKWTAGATYDVSIRLSNIRTALPNCSAPASADIVETVPPGWTPLSPSDAGVIVGNTISWHLTRPSIRVGKVLTYKVKAGEGSGTATFTSMVTDPSVIAPSPVAGERVLYNPGGFTDSCFIQEWLLLGPFKQPGLNGATPGITNLRRDHLTDGAGITEKNVEPRAGDTVHTAYGGAARSTRLELTNRVDLNPGGVPTWYAWTDADDTIDFTTVARRDVDQVMFYAVTYVDLDSEKVLDIGLASDDSVQVLLDGQEIWINNIARPDGGPNAVQDIIHAASTPALNPLTAGRHKFLVKVFEGGGQHTLRLRFQDTTTGQGLCEGISICLDPNPASCGIAPPGPRFLRGDSNADGSVLLGDAIYTLNYLFLGGSSISCMEAADVNDDGRPDITDAVLTLNFLYLGGPPPGLYPSCEIGSPACFYPVSPCGPGLTRHPKPDLRLDIQIERVVEQGRTPNPVTGTVRLTNTEPLDLSVRGWSLSIRAEPQPFCSIQRATIQGTLGAPDPDGLRQGGFEKTELVLGPGDHGVVSSVVLSLRNPVILPGNEVPGDILKLDLAAPFPADGCTPCRLEFVDGLHGSGLPVKNIVDVETMDFQPFSRPVEVRFCSAVQTLAPDGPAASVSLDQASPTAIFKLEPKPVAGSILTVSLDGADPEDASALYVRWGAVPSPTEFDHSADARSRASQRLVIPFARKETCYVLVQGNVFHGGAIQAALKATQSGLELQAVSSSCGDEGCSGQFHLAARGGGFDAATTFALEPSPGQSILATGAVIVSGERAELEFVVPGTPEGLYDLLARKTAGPTTLTARLEDAVRVTRRRIGQRLEASIVAPAYYREGDLRRMTLRYSNTGDEEMRAPIFEVSGSDRTLLGLASETGMRATDFPNFSLAGVGGAKLDSRPLQVLGVSRAGVAGRLPPGASGEIVILFRNPGPFGQSEALNIFVRRLAPVPGSGVAWSSLAAPAGMTATEWNSRWPAIAARYGADYNEALAEIATRLTRRGTRATSIKDLIRFAVLETSGRPSAFILGLARGPDKAPVPSRTVAALSGNAVVACGTTDFEGSFALGPLSNGTYQLAMEGFATASAPVVLAGNADKLHVVLEASSENGSSLHCPTPASEQGLPETGPGLPPGLLEVAATAALKRVDAIDPNTKEGPDEGLTVSPGQKMGYTIYFENCPEVATASCPLPSMAAARQVLIVDPLPALLDPDSIVFTECQFGVDEHVELSSGGGHDRSTQYSFDLSGARYRVTTKTEISVSYPDAQNPVHLLAHITATRVKTMVDLTQLLQDLCAINESLCDVSLTVACDPTDDSVNSSVEEELACIAQSLPEKQFAVWLIDTRVPLTLSTNLPEYYFDSRVGFLPPNNSSPNGEGHVSYEINVKGSAQDGEEIRNNARIVFDSSPTLETKPPVSHIVKNPNKRFIRGDCNGDGYFRGETGDIVFLLNFLFNSGRDPPCRAACDLDRGTRGFGVLNISDALYMVNFLFLGTGPEPAAPWPGCGHWDPQVDPQQSCEAEAVCF